MDEPTVIGLDLAKSVFQLHGASVNGTAVLRRQLCRGQVLAFFSRLDPCPIGMQGRQGCATGSSGRWRRGRASLGA
jgi:transposase